MAVIKVKRGTTRPTLSNLPNTGELGFNYSSNELFIRGNSSVIKVNTLEEVLYYEGTVSTYRTSFSFDQKYVYKFHIVCSTNTTDTSDTSLIYYSNTGQVATGASSCICTKDNYSGLFTETGRNQSTFYIHDGYSNSIGASYATTKVIDFEISPTQESSVSSTYTWVVQGKSTCCSSDQATTPITFALFSHAVDVSLGTLQINTGLDNGSIKTFAITVTRYRRRA